MAGLNLPGFMVNLGAVEWTALLGSTPLEILATVCAIAGVFLIARQRVAGWPLGIVWAAISAWLAFTQWNLVSDGILYVSYIPIQVYCWAVWVHRGHAGDIAAFRPSWLAARTRLMVGFAAVVSILLWGLGIDWLAARVAWIPHPDFLWADATTTVLNYYAQFLQARKRMENWVGWLIVNLLGIVIYSLKGSPIYAIQYGFFLVLGLYGWWQWSRSRTDS